MASYLDKLLEIKPREAYPQSVVDKIKLISFWKKGLATPFGSYIYRMQKYAGDIDLLEEFNEYTDELTVIQQFIKVLKNIIKTLPRSHYFSEFKAGYDPYYNIDIGTLSNGYYTISDNLVKDIYTFFKRGHITTYDYEVLKYLLTDLNTKNFKYQTHVYDYIFEFFRNKRILRWSKNDILNGYINIRNNKYTLAEALKDHTIVKIDLIMLINNKFVEVTNIVMLSYGDSTNGYMPINLSIKDLHNIETLKEEVEKLFYSDKFYSPLKCCKRMYATSRKLKNYNHIEALGQILKGDLSLLYQLVSEMDTFVILLKTLKSPPIAQIKRQLNEMKSRLSTILSIDRKSLVEICLIIDQINTIKNKKVLHDNIKDLYNKLKTIDGMFTLNKMNMLKLNPIPDALIPPDSKYNKTIERNILKNPPDEYKKFVENIDKHINKLIENIKIVQPSEPLNIEPENIEQFEIERIDADIIRENRTLKRLPPPKNIYYSVDFSSKTQKPFSYNEFRQDIKEISPGLTSKELSKAWKKYKREYDIN